MHWIKPQPRGPHRTPWTGANVPRRVAVAPSVAHWIAADLGVY